MTWSIEQRARTGRTTRMLAEAQVAARTGKYVMVIAGSQGHREHLLSRFVMKYGGPRTFWDGPILKHGSGRLSFEVPVCAFDWESLRMRGADEKCVVLVDHWAIESLFAPMLEMLHRFDE